MTLPPQVMRMLADAERLQTERDDARAGCYDACVVSDPALVYAALAALPQRGVFVEWGSGFGVVALLAASLGFDAYGIEIEGKLAAAAEELARRHGLAAEFAAGTFVPADFSEGDLLEDEHLRHGAEGPDGYEELGIAASDVDVFFAFPWPGEEDWFVALFRSVARPGARLVLNRGREGIDVVVRRARRA